MKKNTSIKKSRLNGSLLIRIIILAVALFCLVSVVWFAYQSQESQKKVADMYAAIDKQIKTSNDLYENQLNRQNEGSQSSKALNKIISQFDTEMENSQRLQRSVFPSESPQQQAIANQWKKIKSDLQSSENMQAGKVNIGSRVAQLGKENKNIQAMTDGINKTVNYSQSTIDISEQLKLVAAHASIVISSIENTMLDANKSNVSAVENALANLKNSRGVLNDSLSQTGSIVFNSPGTQGEINKLFTSAQQLETIAKSVLQDLPNLSKVTEKQNATLKKISTLSSGLYALKTNYTGDIKPIAALPFSFLQLMIGLALISLLFFGAWVLLQLASSSRLQKEANRLQSEAVNRTSRDQDAILRLMDDMGGLSEGDLTIEAQVTEDFTGAVADSVNFAVENMREMVGTIIHTSDEITKATENSQNVSRLLSESSNEQSRQISTANETATRMASSLHEIAENTDASVEIARSSVDIAQEGRSRVFSTIKSMTSIRENIQDTAKRIKRLGESSQEIGDIVEIIKGIADQTNVLALNAAIQATAAGEAGRGFAVVADEVQRLAERSANATKRIEVLVKTIQADANEAVASMENSTTQVVSGAGVAEEAGQSLDKIENVSQNLANLIINVSRATRNAAGMAGQVRQGMNKLSDLNQQSVRDVTTSVQSIDNLGELSISLKESVSGFKLPS